MSASPHSFTSLQNTTYLHVIKFFCLRALKCIFRSSLSAINIRKIIKLGGSCLFRNMRNIFFSSGVLLRLTLTQFSLIVHHGKFKWFGNISPRLISPHCQFTHYHLNPFSFHPTFTRNHYFNKSVKIVALIKAALPNYR